MPRSSVTATSLRGSSFSPSAAEIPMPNTAGRPRPPDPTRPSDVTGAPRDDMHVQLRPQIAHRGDIQLVVLGDIFQGACDAGNFRHQLRLLDLLKVDDFHGLRPARYQQQPWV